MDDTLTGVSAKVSKFTNVMVIIAVAFVILFGFAFLELKKNEAQLSSYGTISEEAIGVTLQKIPSSDTVQVSAVGSGVVFSVKDRSLSFSSLAQNGCTHGQVIMWSASATRWVCGNIPEVAGATTDVTPSSALPTGATVGGLPIASQKWVSDQNYLKTYAESDPTLSTWQGSAEVTQVGTITSGTWHGSQITSNYIQDGTLQLGDIGQNGCTDGQTVKWDNATLHWTCAADNTSTPGAVTWLDISDRPVGLDDGDTVLTEGQVENFITNGAIPLAVGSLVGPDLIASQSWVNGQGFLTAADLPVSTSFNQNGNAFGATAVLGTTDNNALQFLTNNAAAVTILATGNVGIGTSTGSAKLTVNGDISVPTQAVGSQAYRINIGTYGTISETAGGLSYITGNAVAASLTANNQIQKTANDAGQFIRMRYDTGISFHTNITGATGTSLADTTNTRLMIDLSGNVGINTAVPYYALHVATSENSLAFVGNQVITAGSYTGVGFGYTESGTYAKSAIVQEQIGDGAARGKVHILNNGTADASSATLADARLTIDYNGNVGIGNTSPAHRLDINGNIGIAQSGYLNFGATDGETGYGIRDNAGNIEYKNSGGSWQAVGGGSTTTAVTPDTPPTSPNAMDDEFNDTTLDPKWTVYTDVPSNGYGVSEHDGALLLDYKSNSSNTYRVISVTQPISGSAWKFRMKLTLEGTLWTYTGATFLIRNSAANRTHFFGLIKHGSLGDGTTGYYGRMTGFTVQSEADLANYWAQTIYLQAEFDGTNMKYSSSTTGINYQLMYTEAVATHLGAAPDQIGIMLHPYNTTNGIYYPMVTVDWFRRIQ